LGIGPLYEHSPVVARALRINASNKTGNYVRTSELFALNPDADLLVVNDYIHPCFDRRINTVSETNLLAREINDFVSGRWAQDGVNKSKHILVLTPASSNAVNSEANHLHSAIVVNAGKHISRGYCAYVLDFDEKGIKQVLSLGIKGRRSFTFDLKTVLAYPPITEQDLGVEIEAALGEQIRDRDIIIQGLRDENKKLGEEQSKLMQEFNKLSKEFVDYKSNGSVSAEEHRRLEREYKILEDQVIDLTSKLSTADNELNEAKEKNQNAINEITKLGLENEAKDQQIEELEKQVTATKRADKSATLSTQNKELVSKVKQLLEERKT
jgi:hypothetical protein